MFRIRSPQELFMVSKAQTARKIHTAKGSVPMAEANVQNVNTAVVDDGQIGFLGKDKAS